VALGIWRPGSSGGGQQSWTGRSSRVCSGDPVRVFQVERCVAKLSLTRRCSGQALGHSLVGQSTFW
jgi:hypothetical protein